MPSIIATTSDERFAKLSELKEGDTLQYVGGGGYGDADIDDLTKGSSYVVKYDPRGSWRHEGRFYITDDTPHPRHFLSVYERSKSGRLWGFALKPPTE